MRRQVLGLVISAATLVVSMASSAATRKCTVNDIDTVYDWSTPSIWTDETAPVAGDVVATVNGNNQTTKLRIGPDDVAHTTDLSQFYVGNNGYCIGSTSIVSIAEGAVVSVNGQFFVGPSGSTSSKCYSKLIVDGILSNIHATAYGRIGYGWTSASTIHAELVQNKGEIYFGAKYPTLAGYGILQMLGGHFILPGYVLDASARTTTLFIDGGTFEGGFTAGGRFRLKEGMVAPTRSAATIGTFSNGIYEPSTDVACIESGVISNLYTRITDGSLLMTNGMIRYSTMQIYPEAGKEAHFTLTDGALTNNTSFVFGDPGKGRVLQGGGYVNMDTSMQFNGIGDYCYTITNGTLISACGWEPAIAARNANCTNATFCLRGTPSVSIFKNYLKGTANTYSNRVHFAFEIDGRGLAPISASPTTNNAAKTKTYPAPLDIMSWHTLQPYGGLQLTTTNAFALFRNLKDEGFNTDDTQARLPNAALWETGDLAPDAEGHPTWGSTLKESAKLPVSKTQAYANAAGVPYGWFPLPRVSGSALAAGVTLGLEAKGENTLDGLVAQIRKGGYAAEVSERTSEKVGKVVVTLPLDRARSKSGEQRNILFDFTSYGTAYDVYEGKVTTNAVVQSASVEIKGAGMMLIFK